MQTHACSLKGELKLYLLISMVEMDHRRSAAKTLVHKVRLST